jgi:uroporphyrinogen III methyltransferase/synthase
VRLKGGDVFVFARGGEEAQALRAAGVPFEIVPGITSAIAAPAYAGIPVTYRGHNTSFSVSTGHENPLKGSSSLDFTKLANPAQTIVFLMAMGNLAAIIGELRKNGIPGDKPVAIVREGTKPTQETLVATLDTILAEVERTKFAAPAIVVVGDVVNERESIRWFDNTPLFGKRVLVTRAAAQADDFCDRLLELGAQPIVAPTIAIGPPDDPVPAADAIERIRDFAWAIFTSRNAVDVFFDRLSERGRDARALGDTKVAAIGPRTAAALSARGIRVDFTPPTFINEAIAAGILDRTRPGDRVLLFRAQEARDVVPQTLRAAGRIVADVAAYKTRTVVDPDLAPKAARARLRASSPTSRMP